MPETTSVLAKTDRNNEIIQRVLDTKGAVSLKAIGDEYHLTRARIQKIVGDAGISMRAIKRAQRKPPKLECGICHSWYIKGTYSEHCKVAGHRRLTPPGEKVERNLLVVQYYTKDGYNTSEIAKYFDIPQPVVTRILHRAGVRATGRRKAKGGLTAGGGKYLNGASHD
jgi:hypothetical protein